MEIDLHFEDVVDFVVNDGVTWTHNSETWCPFICLVNAVVSESIVDFVMASRVDFVVDFTMETAATVLDVVCSVFDIGVCFVVDVVLCSSVNVVGCSFDR